MTTFTVNVDDQQSEEVIKAFLDAMGLDYEIQIKNKVEHQNSTSTMEGQELFNRLKNALCEIKKWEKGEIELNDARSFINELSG